MQFMDNRFEVSKTKLTDVLEDNKKIKYEKHDIDVKNGTLRIIVEDGVPKIIYLTHDHVYIQMCAENSLIMHAVGDK